MAKNKKGKEPRRRGVNGELLEKMVRTLRFLDFKDISYAEWHRSRGDMFCYAPQRLLVKRFRYTTIFGTPGHREWYLDAPEWTGHLECKAQDKSGSVDEKFVYVTETLKRNDVQRLCLVYSGNYWRDNRGRAVIEWAQKERERIAAELGKEFLCFDSDGFVDWAHKVFPALIGSRG